MNCVVIGSISINFDLESINPPKTAPAADQIFHRNVINATVLIGFANTVYHYITTYTVRSSIIRIWFMITINKSQGHR